MGFLMTLSSVSDPSAERTLSLCSSWTARQQPRRAARPWMSGSGTNRILKGSWRLVESCMIELLTHQAREALEGPWDAALGVHLDQHVLARVDVHLRHHSPGGVTRQESVCIG